MDENRKRVVLDFMLDSLKQSSGARNYDFWIDERISQRDLLWRCAVEVLKSEPPPPYQPPSARRSMVIVGGAVDRETEVAQEIFPLALDILWQLCLRGILRPGMRHANGQVSPQGQSYSITLRGREWITGYGSDEIASLLQAL